MSSAECQIKGCMEKHYSNSWCRKHHERWKKHGHPLMTLRKPPKEKTIKRRFYASVSLPNEDGCMLWTGPTVKGYGMLNFGSTHVYAHRFSYELLIGPIPEGMELDHVKAWGCRSTACVNPDHLEPVTPAENKRRSNNIAMQHSRKTHCVNNHEFTEENTRILPNGSRQCKQCRRDYAKRYRKPGYTATPKDAHA